MGLEFAASFNDIGTSLVIDQSGKGRHLDLSTANASQVSGGHDRGALGKTGATMPVLPAAVLAAAQTDDRCIMVDYQSDLTTWIVRYDDPTFGSGMFGLLNLGSPNAVQGQLRDNSGSHNLMTRPSATAPGAAWHNFALVYVRATGVASLYRDGVLAATQSFTAGTQLSTSATAINIAEWSTTGASLDNLRIFSHAPRADEILALANTPVMPDSPIAVLTSGVLGPGMFTRPWLGSSTDVASSSSQSGTLAVTAAASVGIAGTLDQQATLAPAAVASVGLSAVADRQATLPVTATAAMSLAATRDQPATLPVTSAAVVTIAGTVQQPATLAVTAAAAVALTGTVQQSAVLAVTGAAAVTLAATREVPAALAAQALANVTLAGTLEQMAAWSATAAAAITLLGTVDRPAVLPVVGVAQLGLTALVDQPAVLSVTALAAVGLAGVRSMFAVLAPAGVATVGLDTQGQLTDVLGVTAAANVTLIGVREQLAVLGILGAAAVTLGAVDVVPESFAAVGAAQVQLLGTVERAGLLPVTAAARVLLAFAAPTGGGLLLDVGTPKQLSWLEVGPSGDTRWIGPSHAEAVRWLITHPDWPA